MSSLPRIATPWRVPLPSANPGIVEVIHFTDAGCPFAYNAEPALRALESRYGDQLTFRTVMIGLAEKGEDYVTRGYTPERSSLSRLHFRGYGMPMSTGPRFAIAGTAPACRLVKAAECQSVELAESLLRALRFGWFCTELQMDLDESLREVASCVEGLDVERAMADRALPEVEAAYQADRAESRSPAAFAVTLNRTAATDGPHRYTAPSLIFRSGGRELVAPGYQPFEVYDVLVANLVPTIERLPVPELPKVLAAYPGGLATVEVARVLAETTSAPDPQQTEAALIALTAAHQANRSGLAHDAVWYSSNA